MTNPSGEKNDSNGALCSFPHCRRYQMTQEDQHGETKWSSRTRPLRKIAAVSCIAADEDNKHQPLLILTLIVFLFFFMNAGDQRSYLVVEDAVARSSLAVRKIIGGAERDVSCQEWPALKGSNFSPRYSAEFSLWQKKHSKHRTDREVIDKIETEKTNESLICCHTILCRVSSSQIPQGTIRSSSLLF